MSSYECIKLKISNNWTKWNLPGFVKKISLNEAQLRNMMCKWTSKGITKPKVENL